MTLLLLAGTGEARAIADRLAETGVDAIASLAGATRIPKAMPLPTRRGGFGGDAGFRSFLAQKRIGAVLDATHPFAARISHRSARICEEEGVGYCQFLRPEWQQGEGDAWVFLKDEAGRSGAHSRRRDGISGNRAAVSGPVCQLNGATGDLPCC